jgi:hypothetical protein
VTHDVTGNDVEGGRPPDGYDNSYSFIIGSYHLGVPYLARLESETCYAGVDINPLVAEGSPRSLAEFIADGTDLKNIPSREAFPLAAYLVNACIEFDSACDRPLQIGAIFKADGECWDKLPKQSTRWYQDASQEAHEDIQQDLVSRLYQYYCAHTAKWKPKPASNAPLPPSSQSPT